LVPPREGSLDDPAHSPEARAVLGGAAGDDRLDAADQSIAPAALSFCNSAA
jgi:hypothetical protein